MHFLWFTATLTDSIINYDIFFSKKSTFLGIQSYNLGLKIFCVFQYLDLLFHILMALAAIFKIILNNNCDSS